MKVLCAWIAIRAGSRPLYVRSTTASAAWAYRHVPPRSSTARTRCPSAMAMISDLHTISPAGA